jgi:hypothetical protein
MLLIHDDHDRTQYSEYDEERNKQHQCDRNLEVEYRAAVLIDFVALFFLARLDQQGCKNRRNDQAGTKMQRAKNLSSQGNRMCEKLFT